MYSRDQIAYDLILALLLIIFIILGLILYFFCRKKPVESEETLSFKASAPTYPLTDIDAATDGFNHRRVIGKGRLELLTGRRSEEGLLVKWALPLIKENKFSELLDARLAIPSDTKPIIRLAKVASACISNSRKSRPTIVQVAAILNSLEAENRDLLLAFGS
ncbi:hypothetical protein GH714_016157 [Hevea brasiliensis]|uniref:Serine-threonine/tyrosine-protein kinase catalytic domain-containing protein n=1 Tax=Hevea brasiliensis TaxID=3981 RepID=A0A6A6LQD4_HEVBR|nr:hypothetical protein GH714_016157 [Hevea brasiliensis]